MKAIYKCDSKMKFSDNKQKWQLLLTYGTTLPPYGILKRQNTVTKLNKSISSAHNILSQKHFNSSNDLKILCVLPLYMGAVIDLLVSYVEIHRISHGMYICRLQLLISNPMCLCSLAFIDMNQL